MYLARLTFDDNSPAALDVLQGLARMLTGSYELKLLWGPSCTDGKTIWVHQEPWYFAVHGLSTALRMTCKRATTAHEAFHVRYSDFEAYDAFLRDPDLLSQFHVEVLRAFGNGAEDGRIELIGANDFPGTLEWLQLQNGLAVKAMQIPKEPVASLLQGFIARQIAGFYPDGYPEAWPQWFEILEGMVPLMEQARRAPSTLALLEIVREMLSVIKPYLPPVSEQMPAPDPARDTDHMREGVRGKAAAGEVGSLDPHIRTVYRVNKSGPSEEGEEGPEAESGPNDGPAPDTSKEVTDPAGIGSEESPDGGADVDEILDRLKVASEAREAEAMKEVPSVLDDPTAPNSSELEAMARSIEEEIHHGCTLVVEQAIPQPKLYEAVIAQTEDLRNDLTRELHVLVKRIPSELESRRRSGSLHVGSLWRLPALGDPRVFAKRRSPYNPAVAVYLLADISGSMRGTMQYGKQQLRRVDAVRLTLSAFCGALESLNIVHGASAFTSHGMNMHHRRLLKFGQHSGREAVVDFKTGSNNRDGYHLRLATKELAARPEPIKILFMLSDGQPACTGYCGPAAVADTALARAEAQRMGVHVVGFYFGDLPDRPGGEVSQALKQEMAMFTRERLVIVRDMATLAPDMSAVLRQIVARYRVA